MNAPLRLAARILTSTIVTLLAAPALAQDAGVAPAAPSIALDDGTLWFSVDSQQDSVNGRRIDRGYIPHANVRVWGAFPAESAVVLTYSQRGQQLGRVRCAMHIPGFERDLPFSHGVVSDCYDRGVSLTATGDVQVELRAVNGLTDAETVLATRVMNVQRVAHSLGGTPPMPGADSFYVSHHSQVIDSVLNWASFTDNDSYANTYVDNGLSGTLVSVLMTFNGTDESAANALNDLSVRCQVNGQPLTPQNSPLPANTSQLQYQLFSRGFTPPGGGGGVQQEAWKDRQITVQLPFRSTDMRARPGRWTCDLRSNGRNLRRWAWTVASNGVPERHPEQSAGLNLGPRAVLIETTIPADGGLDQRTNPSEAQRGGFHGRPWTSDIARTQAAAVPAIGAPFFPYAPLRGALSSASGNGASSSAAASSGPRRRRR